MEIEKMMKPVYKINGKEFTTLAEAENYKNKLENLLSYTYYIVGVKPDLTEGRGYYDRINVAVKESYLNNVVTHYLVKTYGSPIALVMGVSPMDNWIVRKGQRFSNIGELDKFLNDEVTVGIGDYRTPKKIPTVYLKDTAEIDYIINQSEGK